jgi:glycosyltransferase involved in cell wall biosynthesis
MLVTFMAARNLIAVSGSGAIGWNPLDRRTWSGVSYEFFSRVQKQGRLHRAFGVEVAPLPKWLLMALNFHPERKRWRKQFYSDVRYRNRLTDQVRRQLRDDDLDHDIIQIGAMFNAAEASGGRTRHYVYMDSNVVVSMRSPYAPIGIPARTIDRIVAYERQVYHSMTRIFTGGEYLRDSLIEDFGVPAEKIVVLGLGMTLEHPPQPPPDKSYDTNQILFLGAGFDRKGGWHLLRAFQTVRKAIPAATLHIVGPHNLVIPPALSAGVIYHGHLRKHVPTEWAQLERVFQSASLFVLPSLYEPFGMAPLEAMAYQIPAIVSDMQALREIVKSGVTGELVQPGDEEELGEKIIGLLSNPDRLAAMGIRAREHVMTRYTWDVIVARFFDALPG